MDISTLLDRISASPNSRGMDLPQGVSKEEPKLNEKSAGGFDEKLEKATSKETPKAEVSDSKSDSRSEKVSEKDSQSNSRAEVSEEKVQVKDDQVASKEKRVSEEGEQAVQSVNPKAEDLESVSSQEGVELVQLDDTQLDEKLAAFLNQMGIKPDLVEKIMSNDKMKAELVQNLPSLEKANAIPELKSDIQNVIKQWVAASSSKEVEVGSVALKQMVKTPEIQKIMQEAGLKMNPEQLPTEKTEISLKPAELTKTLHQRIESLVKNVVAQQSASKGPAKNQVDEVQLKSLMKSVSEVKAKPVEINLANSEEAVSPEMPIDRPARFKDLVDGLFVQKGLNHQTTDQQLIQFSKNEFQNIPNELRGDSKVVRANLFEDMQTHIAKSLITKEGGEISLRLRPGNLGEVKLNVQVDAKSVKIHMETDKAAASQMLKSQVSDLKQQLSAAGLKVDDISISQSKQSSAQDEQRHSNLDQRQDQSSDQQQRQRQEKEEESSSLFSDYEDEILSSRSVA